MIAISDIHLKLLNIRYGPGAAILPSEVTRIHLEFAKRWNDGQYGPRYGRLTKRA